MPTPSLLPSAPVTLTSTSWSHEADVWFIGLDGRDLQRSLDAARRILAAGAWRPWMLTRFRRIHRHDEHRLLRHLLPLLVHAPPHARGDTTALAASLSTSTSSPAQSKR